VMIAVQQVFGLAPAAWHWWDFIYTNSEEGPGWINVLYVLVPWIGVMMAGYGFGRLLTFEPARRNRLCLRIGLTAIVVFLTAGTLLARFGHASKAPFIFRLLNQQKYPPSQLFLLMTLGPIIALVPFAERAKGWLAKVFITFGRVPFFYYLLHIPLIHLSALLVNQIRTGNVHQDWYHTAPYTWLPQDQHWSLPLLYLVFILLEVLLFLACRWYAHYKLQHPGQKWLKFL